MRLVNELWIGLYGNPLFQIVESMGHPARRGERFYKAVDHSADLSAMVSAAYTVIPIISALGLLRVASGSEIPTGIQNAANLLQSNLIKRERDFSIAPAKNFTTSANVLNNITIIISSHSTKFIARSSTKADVLTYLKERQWTKSDVSKNMPDSKLRQIFAVYSHREVASWVLSFGEDCEVIGPPNFRYRIAKVVSGMGKIYG